MKKLTNYFFVLFVLIAFGCGKNEDPTPGTPATPGTPTNPTTPVAKTYILTKTATAIDGQNFSGTYTYDAQGRLTKISGSGVGNGDNVFNYPDATSKLITKAENIFEGKLFSTDVIEYDAQGNWTKVTSTYADGLVEVATPTRGTDVFTVKTTNNRNSNVDTETWTYKDGNVISHLTESQEFNEKETETYEYGADAKDVKDFNVTSMLAGPYKQPNIQSKKAYTKITNGTDVTMIATTLNTEGYVTKTVASGSSVYTVDFTYDCK